MTKYELMEWMGWQSRRFYYDTVRVVVECADGEQAQLIADAITEIMEGQVRFDADPDGAYWKYLWLYHYPGEDRVINAYRFSFPLQEFENAVIITGNEWLEAICRYKNKVEVGDLI